MRDSMNHALLVSAVLPVLLVSVLVVRATLMRR